MTITSRRLKDINADSFTDDVRQSALVKNPAAGVDGLVNQYDSVLSNILDAHAPSQQASASTSAPTLVHWLHSGG